MKGIPTLGSTAFLAGAIAIAVGIGDSRQELVDAMDKHYQERFADLAATKEGRFGISRVESNETKSHMNISGAPGYGSRDFQNSVSIYGSGGRKLDSEKLKRVYQRFPNGIPVGFTTEQAQYAKEHGQSKFGTLDAAKQWLASDWPKGKDRLVVSQAGMTYEVRPVRLSKKECLPCHTGMALGDPIALIVYSTSPIVKSKS